MKVVILCGGKGTRLSELTKELQKPMIEIGGKPILWHLMKLYAHYGHSDFILCTGYKGKEIMKYFSKINEGWNVEFSDSGEATNKAQRIKAIENKINEDQFLVSYGDDLTDVDINRVIDFHKKKGKMATLVSVPLVSPFGIIRTNENDEVCDFEEKPVLKDRMNGGFYVFSRRIFSHLKSRKDLEKDVLKELAGKREVAAFQHDGFWKSINTLKDVIEFNELVKDGTMPWKVWP